ncbi:hypothetical protein DYU05_01045 [Mucilaginibacter terrenus]|uniref:Calcineurin-like phosphoesterase domain-containing protein n=1 Tax=Mucilaginibacter terrenus TaxID=2482727 RepID=A0A3E2NTG8_9SPHI|nr:BamA/TamA family outer membrane protein [Mucilaginibacter terrenus]RFZ84247.1 hypothetical protein DYU05_01045 [Mucilaginibacter terrenus]
MRKLLLALILLFPSLLMAQTGVRNRVILIGDAGEIDPQQSFVLTNAATRIIKDKTTVVYLGDNIYPTGMGMPGSKEEEGTKNILKAQFTPMRKAGAPVYFIPGNHDWDRMGPLGMAKVKREWEFLTEQKDSLLKSVPRNGCPDPTEINISKDMVMIAFDSEWWLYLYNKDNPLADCDCQTNDEIIYRFRELLYKNRNKVILLADHHPFRSYGHHGGTYVFKDYLFPLTSVNQKLYIPFPLIGALYPLLRGTFDNPEDNGHPLYRTMMAMIDGVFASEPNVIRVSGHEHGLQFIKDGSYYQVVSGSGAKRAVTIKGKNSLYGAAIGGYVTVDQMEDKSVKFTYYANTVDSTMAEVFTYTKPYVKVEIPLSKPDKVVVGDSITVSANNEFARRNELHRVMFGKNYRSEWTAKTTVPVIRVSKYKGGLTPVEFGGAHQKQALVLKDAAGKTYIMSSIEKYPLVLLPQALSQTFAKSWLKDAMSAQHPYGALISPVIAQAVNLRHTNPIIGYVAPDSKLGYYESQFSGKLVLLENREPGDSSLNTGNMIAELNKSNNNRLDTVEYLKTRLLDWFLGDWDQQPEKLRWLASKRGENTYYSAIPIDRAEAFYVNQGLIPNLAAKQYVARYLKGYNASVRSVNDFFYNSNDVNTRFLSQLDQKKWLDVTRNFKDSLTDAVLESSLRRLPQAIYKLSHDRLLKEMKQRRATLLEASEKYYTFLSKKVDVKATDISELFVIKDTLDNKLLIRVNKLPITKERSTVYFRVFDPATTNEVRVYTGKGNDSLFVNNTKSPIKLRIIGGSGHRVYNFMNTTPKVRVYEKTTSATFLGNFANIKQKLSDDSSNVAYVPTNRYHTVIPLLSVGYDLDQGFYADAGVKYLHQGFRKNPSSTTELTVGHSFGYNSTRIKFLSEVNAGLNNLDKQFKLEAYLPNSINFFGRGNKTGFDKDNGIGYYRDRFNYFIGEATLRWQNAANTESVQYGVAAQYYHFLQNSSPGFIGNTPLINSYDSTSYRDNKFHAGLTVTYIDDKRNRKILTNWGVYVHSNLRAFAGFGNSAKPYVQWLTEATLYKSVDVHSNFVITEKAGAGVTFGKAAFYQSVFLGGENSLIGYRENRFAGEQMLYNNLEARYRLNSFLSYILPGQYGLTARYDVGRVWDRSEHSNAVWHNGFGVGAYFSPSDMALLQLKAGYSKEGWYPYVNFKLTF